MTDTIDNGRILADNDLQVVHFGPAFRASAKDRPFTVAFRAMGDVMEISTAVTHPKDKFVKKIGTRVAVENFLNGKTIKVVLPRHYQRHYSSFIRVMFAL